MISIVRAFGAPVMEAAGNVQARISSSGAVLSALTSEVICHSVG